VCVAPTAAHASLIKARPAIALERLSAFAINVDAEAQASSH
jgi:hypothetical protein